MAILYESARVRVSEDPDEGGELQRRLLLAPHYSLQGAIYLARPTFHIHQFTRHLTYAAAAVSGGVRRALFLGLGAGIVVQAVRSLFPQATFDVVDLDSEVIEVSHRYFFPLDDESVNLYAVDAAAFVASRGERTYDFVCCDVWGSGLEVPPFVISEEFLAHIARLLTGCGVAAFNTSRLVHKDISEGLLRQLNYGLSLEGNNALVAASNNPFTPLGDDDLIARLAADNVNVRKIEARLVAMQRTSAPGCPWKS